jgi:HEAT repeat protein
MSQKKREELSKEEKVEFLTRIIERDDYGTDYQPLLEDFLDDPDPEIRALAISGLWDYPDPTLIDYLFATAKEDPSQEVRSKALVVLGRYIYEGDSACYDLDLGPMEELIRQDELPEEDFQRIQGFLLSVSRDESESLDSRRFAIEALSFLHTPEVLSLIEEAYNHPDLKMKVSAIFAMGRNGHKRWWPFILKELDSTVLEPQYEAVRAAGEAYLEDATPRLISLIESTADKTLCLEAIWALGQTGGDAAYEFLKKLQSDQQEDEEISKVAEAALYELLIAEIPEEGAYLWYEDDEDWGDGNGMQQEDDW